MHDHAAPRLNRDFWLFWAGQTISNLGSSFTAFALPLLIYRLSGSAMNLAIATAANFVPYLLFGLIIGAWVDRVDRKRLMIWVNIVTALVIASIPLLAMAGTLPLWWIYGVGFVASTLGIAFQAAEFAAIPSLVEAGGDLVAANGRIQASYSAAGIVGPLLAGLLAATLPLYDVLLVDAASFLLSAGALALLRVSFNTVAKPQTNVRQDVLEGLRYVLGHPVLRAISAMMALVNFVGTTVSAQLVLFAQQRFAASAFQISVLYAAGSLGVVVLSLAAGPLRKRWSFSRVALGALMLQGALTVVFAWMPWFWAGALLWLLIGGLGMLFNINTGSLRQTIVPNHMLGRVMSIAGVLAWSAIPLGTLLGGALIEATGDVSLVYGAVGVLLIAIPFGFSFSALGRAEQFLPQPEPTPVAA